VLSSGTSNAFFNLPKEQVAEELRNTGYDLEAAIRPTLVLSSGTSNAFFNLPKEQVAEELRNTGYDLQAAIRPTRLGSSGARGMICRLQLRPPV